MADLKKPRIGPKEVVYKDQYTQIYKVTADFGDFTKEYVVRDAGGRSGILIEREGSVLLVRQYRLLINDRSWELPGGKVDDGETPEAAAVRECLEETGLRCLDLRPLVFFHSGLDANHNPNYIFLSGHAEESSQPHEFDPLEVSSFEWVPLAECYEMIYNGKIVDYYTIMALLAHQYQTANGGLQDFSKVGSQVL